MIVIKLRNLTFAKAANLVVVRSDTIFTFDLVKDHLELSVANCADQSVVTCLNPRALPVRFY